MDFIAFDWCGWMDNYGRFTHLPSGDTIVQQGWMGQRDWDKAQLDYFKKYPGLEVHRNLQSGPYQKTGNLMGTTDEICARLENRLAS